MITQQEKTQKNIQSKQFFELSRQTALKIKKLFPDAQIYPFDPITNECHWSWKKMGGCTDIEGYTAPKNRDKNIIWGLKMSSVPLIVKDYDIKPPKKEGMSQEMFQTLKREFGLNDYPYFTQSRSGFGGHAWYKKFPEGDRRNIEKGKDHITGIDYKSETIVFLTSFPFEFGTSDLKEVPQKFFEYNKSPKARKKQGRFHTQQKDSYSSLMNGSPEGIFEAYREARNAGQTVSEAMSVAKPTLEKLEFIPTPEPPQNKKISSAKEPIKKDIFKGFNPTPKPRKWLFDEKIFIQSRDNQLTADPGVGKSTFSRETALRYWEAGGTILLFAQEDSPSEDIAPFLVYKGFKEGVDIPRFHVFWDWYKHPVAETIAKFKHIPNKFVVIDPVHALFADISKPAECRKLLLKIRDEASAPGDTRVYINHPKSFWKENKLSGSELNASTKELGRICRGSIICRVTEENLNIIEHSKRQLDSERYSFNLVQDWITNKKNEECSFSRIENFKPLKHKPKPGESILPAQKNLSEKRQNIRREIKGVCGALNDWTPRSTILIALKNQKVKEADINRELSIMVQEGILERDYKDRKSVYRLKC